jgi:hypothetical protein
MSINAVNTQNLLQWAQTLIGIKYKFVMNNGLEIINPIPMYGIYSEIPNYDFIKSNGCNAVGLINLLRLKNNKNIPGHNDQEIIDLIYIGSLGLWFRELNKIQSLQKFNKDSEYCVGTLLIKKVSEYDYFGHMAIVVENNQILHSYSETNQINDIYNDPGICLSNMSNFSFDFICYPDIWLYHNF